MSDKIDNNVNAADTEQKNNETNVPLSKSAKKKAKKNQKKAAIAAEAVGSIGTSQTQPEEVETPQERSEPIKTTSTVGTAETATIQTIQAEKKLLPAKPNSQKTIHMKADKGKLGRSKISPVKLADIQEESSRTGNEDEEQLEIPVNNAPKNKKPVPRIQKFDANGKPIKVLAGRNSLHLGEITPHNVFQLKTLNEAVLPIKYNDKFYVEARTCGDFGRLAYFNDVVAGAVCCRIDDISDEKALYIMTLGTLAAYRQIGIGAVLIDYVHRLCDEYDEINSVYLHVQVNNQNAVHFYEKHGFTNDGIIEDYYRIEPRDAYLLIKRIRY